MISFTYSKNGILSNRVIIPIHHPTDKFLGIDISELDEEQQGLCASEYEFLMDKFDEYVDILMKKYDCNYRIRSFFPDAMSNVKFE